MVERLQNQTALEESNEESLLGDNRKSERLQNARKRKLNNWNKLIALVGSCYTVFITLGLSYSMSVLYTEILDVFDTTRRETSLIQSVCIGCTFGSGLLGGILVETIGIKCVFLIGSAVGSLSLFLSWFATSVPFLIVTVGLGVGSSTGVLTLATNVFVASVFNTRRNQALVLLAFSTGVSQSILPPLYTTLSSEYGFRGCFLLMGGLYLNLFVSSLVITSSLGMPLPYFKTSNKKDRSHQWKKLLNLDFIALCVGATLAISATTNLMVAIMDILRSKGISGDAGVRLYIVCCAAALVLRLLIGVLNMIRNVHSLLLFSTSATLAGVSLIILADAKSVIATSIFMGLAWIGHSGMISTINLALLDILGLEVFSLSCGVASLVAGVVTPAGSSIMGWIFDRTMSYELPLFVFGGLTIMSGLLVFVLFYRHRQSTKTL